MLEQNKNIRSKSFDLWLGLFLALQLFLLAGFSYAGVKDIRVLIDVSGSMKKNDPQNLRAPALRLLVGLMPEGTEAGVWTFAEHVNMQVRQGRVNAGWKKLARSESKYIHSRGLYTNIEDALSKATADWKGKSTNSDRNIILLTDGVVDISKDKKKNQASRQRIQNKILPRLKKLGAKIHTIALSGNVDKALLSQLSGVTGGRFEEVNDASSLERVFLKLFEASAPTPTLPIKGNRFTVDGSVNDMTVLLFRNEEEEITLINPAGKKFTNDSHPDQYVWHKEKGYELVTIKKPAIGDWVISGSEDPDNRVMIVTNLKLKINELPTSLLFGDKKLLTASLLEKEKIITRKSFLSLVSFDVYDGENKLSGLSDSGAVSDAKKGDGVYSGYPFNDLKSGEHEIIVRATGATFIRNIRHALAIYKSLAEIKITRPENAGQYYVNIIPRMQLLDPKSIKVNAVVKDQRFLVVEDTAGLWTVSIDEKYKGETVKIKIEATRHNGQKVTDSLSKKIYVEGEGPAKSELAPEPAPSVAEPEKAVENELSKTTEQLETVAPDNSDMNKKAADTADENTEEKVVDEENAEEESDWLLTTWIVIMINMFLGILGMLLWKLWKKQKAKHKEEGKGEDEEVAYE